MCRSLLVAGCRDFKPRDILGIHNEPERSPPFSNEYKSPATQSAVWGVSFAWIHWLKF